MNQTFYIDVDEEISSVIDRLRKSMATDNFFVVPKRALFVQSIINLKLLKREADNLGKHIVIVTQDEYAMNMAEKAGLEIKTSQEGLEQSAEKVEAAPVKVAGAGKQADAEQEGQNIPAEKKPNSLRLRAIGSEDFYGEGKKEAESEVFVPRMQTPRRVPVYPTEKPLRSVQQQAVVPAAQAIAEREAPKLAASLVAAPPRPTSSDIAPPKRPEPTRQQPTYADAGMQYAEKMDSEKERSIEKIFRTSPPSPAVSAPASDVPVKVGKRGKKVIMVFVLLCAAAFVGVAAYVFVPSAKVEVVLDTQKKVVSTQLTASEKTSPETGGSAIVVPLRQIEIEETVSLDYDSTGTSGSSGKKAQGKVVIYNAYSDSPQTLITTTRLETEDGKIFRLVKNVTVPAMVGSGSAAKPGAIEADVVADQPGDSFNIEPSKFSIPGFKDSPKFEKFSAQSSKPMMGGVSGDSSPRAVSEGDIAKAKEKSEKALAEKLKEKIIKDSQEGEVVLDGATKVAIEESTTPVKAGDVKDTFSYSVKGKMKALVFAQSEVDKSLEAFIGKDVDKQKFEAAKVSTPDYSEVSADFDAKILKANVDAMATLVPLFDAEQFKKEIVGLDENRIKQVVSQKSGIKNVNIEFFPMFIATMPKFVQRITAEVNAGE